MSILCLNGAEMLLITNTLYSMIRCIGINHNTAIMK